MTEANRGAFLRLCLAGGLAYCSYAMCRTPLLPLFARRLGASPELVGLVVGASTVTGIFVKLPVGALSDVISRRTLLVLGAAVFALLPFAYLPVAALSTLLVLRFVHGNATAIFSPVASALVSDLAPAAHRGRWLSVYSAIQGAGQAIGPVAAGYLIAAGDFDRAFVVSGCLGTIALLLLVGRSSEARREQRTAWWRRAADAVREVSADARILITSLAQAGQFFVNGTVNAFLPLFAVEVLGRRATEIGVIFGAQTVSALVARPLFGELSDRVGRPWMIFSGLLACAVAMTAISLATGFGTLLAAACLHGTGLAVTTSAASAYVTDLARQRRYGAAHGIFGTIYDVGDAAGPIVAGVLVAAVGYRETFRLISAAAALLALVFVAASRTWATDPSCGPMRG